VEVWDECRYELPMTTALAGRCFALVVLGAAAAACSPLAPDRGRVVSSGVAAADFEARARATDLVPTRVIFPADDDGLPRKGAPFPALVFVQGGAVDASRYDWLAERLARRGYVVALPRHSLELAILETGNAAAALELLTGNFPPRLLSGLVNQNRVAVGGHSLGGVIAVKAALEKGFAAVVLEASLPDSADDQRLPALGVPSLSLAGAADCSAERAEVEAGWAKLPSPTALVVLPGVTHYQFTDSDAEDRKRGCTGSVDVDAAHEDIERAVAAFLDAALTSGEVGEVSLRAVAGAEVSVR
jgi:dienelactone hydrolase